MAEPRNVVVTGGTRGLGREIARAFLAAGDNVWVLARTEPVWQDGTGRMRFIAVDVRRRPELDAAAVEIRREAGAVDAWVNNAGYGTPVPFCDADNARWEDIFAVNFWGTVHASRVALPLLRARRGALINIASLAGLMAPPGHSAYSSAKAAVIALTRSLAVEYAEEGIRVNAIAPGPLDTEGFRAAGGDPVARAAKIPTRRMIKPGEVAASCLFLARAAGSLTGQVLTIDGGSHAAGCYA